MGLQGCYARYVAPRGFKSWLLTLHLHRTSSLPPVSICARWLKQGAHGGKSDLRPLFYRVGDDNTACTTALHARAIISCPLYVQGWSKERVVAGLTLDLCSIEWEVTTGYGT